MEYQKGKVIETVLIFPKNPEPLQDNYYSCFCSAKKLEASYTCCRSLGVPADLARPQKILEKNLLAASLTANSILITLAEKIITSVCCDGPEKEYIFILCDPNLASLKIFGSTEVLAAAEGEGINPGAIFTEASCGTNALALAYEQGRIIAMRGEQHYCRMFKDWWCVAGPIKDTRGKILGYLDISMHAGKELGTTTALLKTLLDLIKKEFIFLEAIGIKGNEHYINISNPEINDRRFNQLSPREKEILEYLVLQASTKEIAATLYLSPHTVKTYRKRIYQKLGINSLLELINNIKHR
ncbi:MAG: hypothetical protein STSR0004_11970 [Peptococcaceae bacterium]